jgi:hypothetical protein
MKTPAALADGVLPTLALVPSLPARYQLVRVLTAGSKK